MSVVLGEQPFAYRVDTEWAKLPEGWSFGEVTDVSIDRQDRVYVFARCEHPLMVFDRDGNFLTSWGEGMFRRPHGLHVGPDDTIWCTDDYDQTVRKCTLDGKVLLTLGESGKASPFMSGLPFCRCTHTAVSPEGDIYVTDGYGNARVHKFSPDGKLLFSWGESGCDPGQFNVPHNVCCDRDGWVYVLDRENCRIQIFDGKGRYETQWNNLHRPNGLFLVEGAEPIWYIAENGPTRKTNRNFPNLGSRVTLFGRSGKLLVHLGAQWSGHNPGEFLAPHGIAVDSHNDIYVGEVSRTAWSEYFPGEPMPAKLRSFQKLCKV